MTPYLDVLTLWGMRVLSAVLILIAGWVIGNWVSARIRKVNQLDNTLSGFLAGFAKYAIFAVAIITILAQFGVQTASLIAVLGAAGLAVGLALQGTLSNVAAGIMLLILRPFNVGDYIVFGGTGGTVKSLGLFGTELATPDNVYIYAPNSNIWNNEITNYSRNPTRRQDFVVSISYSDDINAAMDVLRGIVAKDPRVVQDGENAPQVMVSNMGEFSIDLIVRIWSQGADYWALRWDLTKVFKEDLEKNGLTIPFPTRTLLMQSADGAPAEPPKKAGKS